MNLIFTREAKEDLLSLDKKTQRRIHIAIERFRKDPAAVNLKKIRSFKNKWRMKVGNWRIIIELNKQERAFYILEIIRRSKRTYRR